MVINKLEERVWYVTDFTVHGDALLKEIRESADWAHRFGSKNEDGSWDEDGGPSFVESLSLNQLKSFNAFNKDLVKCVQNYLDELEGGKEVNLVGHNSVDKHYPPTRIPSHTDNHPGLAVLIYMNDDYEGGELSISIRKDMTENGVFQIGVDDSKHPEESSKNIDLWVKPAAASILFLPAQAPYYHTAHKITAGHKYLIKALQEL